MENYEKKNTLSTKIRKLKILSMEALNNLTFKNILEI